MTTMIERWFVFNAKDNTYLTADYKTWSPNKEDAMLMDEEYASDMANKDGLGCGSVVVPSQPESITLEQVYQL